MKPCKHCGYTRKRQLKKGSPCPKCGYKGLSILTLFKRALRAFKPQPYKPRVKDAQEV